MFVGEEVEIINYGRGVLERYSERVRFRKVRDLGEGEVLTDARPDLIGKRGTIINIEERITVSGLGYWFREDQLKKI